MRVDIVIPVWNQPNTTKNCLESIFKNTEYPYHLIIADNGSEKQTESYLKKAKEENPGLITLLRNEKNKGFVKAVNQGMKLATAQYICILNNDTLVTKGWLTEMVNIAENNPKIGLLNPSSNNFGQEPKKGQTIDMLAENLLKEKKGQWATMANCIGFCMLIRHDLIKRIGMFDEIYGVGNFEDTDFSKRAKEAGFICARAKAAYIHHIGNVSFKKMKKQWQDSFRRNQALFYKKWGKPRRIFWSVFYLSEMTAENISKEILNLVEEGNWVWLVSAKSPFEINVQDYPNMRKFILPRRLFHLRCLLRILKRRKKKFDAVFTDNLGFANTLERLKPLHGAEVVYPPSRTNIEELWQRKFLCQW